MKEKFPFLKQDEEHITLSKHRKWSPEQSDHFNRTYSQLLALPRQMRRRLQRKFGLSLVGLALTLALSGTPIASIIQAKPASVPTAGITVDGTTCTLEEAITSANNDNAAGNGCDNGSGADIITLTANVTLTAVNNTSANGPNGLPVITSEITIEGADFTIARDGGAPDFRLFEVAASGDLTLNKSTIQNGYAGAGAGILVGSGATLAVNNSTIANNSGSQGCGIQNRGTATITNSTISGNSGTFAGGGIRTSGNTTLINSTVTGNHANTSGGGVGLLSGGTLTLERSIIAGNSATNGKEIDNLFNIGTITNNGFNVVGSSAATRAANFSGFTPGANDVDASSDQQNIALASILNTTLADNGGETLTHALVSGSPAIDIASSGPATDQRGYGRPVGSGYDAGAFEYGASAPASPNARINSTDCDLIDAITAANTDSATGDCAAGSAGADTITLLSNVTLTAVNNTSANGPNGLPVITSEITIEGADFTIARDGGAPDFRLFEVAASGDLTLNNTTVSGGNLGLSVSSPFRKGGGLFTDGGTLTLNNSTVSNNDARSGAGIDLRNPAATLTLNNSIVSGNGNQLTRGGGIEMVSGASGSVSNSNISNNTSRYGGGFYAEGGSLEITNSTINGNTASDYGGGMYIDNSSTVITITNSTISNNTADEHGGGIADDEGASVTITNSTISGNNAPEGGGLHLNDGANDDKKMSLINSTIISNTATIGQGGGIYNNSYMTLSRSLLSGNTASSDGDEIHNSTGKIITANANNLLADSSKDNAAAFTNFTPGASDINATSDSTNVALASILNTTLADNGGDTLTHALVSGSPAIDAAGSCGLATDQRGATRAGGAGSGGNSCDIGAYEYDSLPLAVTLASLQAIATGEHVVVRWETVSELNNLGFNLYRSTSASLPELGGTEGGLIKLNASLIPAQAPGSGQGSAYEFVDEELEAGESYYYWLEDIDLDGQTGLHGPISATVNEPTAVTLDSLSIDMPTFSLWGLMAFMLTLLMGGWAWRRQ